MTGPTLLIGGMGFIGLHTARSFLDAGQDVVLTYYHNRREPDFLKDEIGKRAKVEQLDVLDAARVAEIESIRRELEYRKQRLDSLRREVNKMGRGGRAAPPKKTTTDSTAAPPKTPRGRE